MDCRSISGRPSNLSFFKPFQLFKGIQMNIIKWDQKYSVGIESIDVQHKQLFKMLSGFYERFQTDSQSAYDKLVDDAFKYVEYHFGYEETSFKRYGYDDTEAHIKEHKLFINKLLDIKQRKKEGKPVLTMELTNYLKNWLVEHILGVDMKYSQFLRDKGMK